MRETCSSGSVRGAFSNERPYRERIFLLVAHPGEGPLTAPTAAVQAWRTELGFMAPSRRPSSMRSAPRFCDKTISGVRHCWPC